MFWNALVSQVVNDHQCFHWESSPISSSVSFCYLVKIRQFFVSLLFRKNIYSHGRNINSHKLASAGVNIKFYVNDD